MKNKERILIADPNSAFCSHLKQELDQQPDMEVVGVATDGADAVRQVEAQAPDVLLMDIILPELDGIGVLQALDKLEEWKKPVIVVMTRFITERMEEQIASLGVQYLLVKPFRFTSLVNVLHEQAEPFRSAVGPCDQMTLITEMLLDMGVPTHIKGFPYTRDAILLTLSAQYNNTGLTKCIYPEVAKKYSTTVSRVERAIRHAIEVAWTRGDIEAHFKLFRNSVSAHRGKPTNAEFISTLAQRFSLQENAVRSGTYH